MANAAKQLGLPADEPPTKPVEPPAEAPQPQPHPSASNGIPEDRRGFVGTWTAGSSTAVPNAASGAHTESASFCAAASSKFGTARSTNRRVKEHHDERQD
jgi:hypothetical protein